jgi:fibronectin-binding autotransporter adhesin
LTGGVQALFGNNTFTGAVNVTGGTLLVDGVASTSATVSGGTLGGTLSAGTALTISDTGTYDNGNDQTIASLTQTGGTLTGGSTLTVSGDYALSGGTVTTSRTPSLVVNTGTFTMSGGTIAAGAKVNSDGARTLSGGTIAGTLGGTGAATVQTGTVTIAGTGTLAGGATTISSGTLAVDGGSVTSNIIMDGGTLAGLSDSTVAGTITQTASGGTITAATGTTLTLDRLNPINAGTLSFGASGATGTVRVNASSSSNNRSSLAIEAGTLQIGGSNAAGFLFGSVSGTSVAAGAAFDLNGFNALVTNLSGTGTVTTSGGDARLSLSGASIFGGVIEDGASVVSVSLIGLDTTTFTGTNTYSGTTTITGGGTLRIGDGGTTGTLGTGNVVNNSALVFDRSDDHTVANAISGNGSLTQQGLGMLTLAGVNTYTGLTRINSGTLRLSGGSAIADAGPVSVAAGATLRVDQTETVGALTSLGTVDLSTGNGTADTVLTVNGNHTGGGILRLDAMLGDDTALGDRVVITGDSSGTTSVFVNLLGGPGAPTTTGILLVDVGGASNGSFVLANGDTVLPGGATAITAPGGVFLYTLENTGGDWRLQSQVQPAAVVYEALPFGLLGLTQARGLTERLGNRRMLTGATDGGVTASSRGGAGALQAGAWLDTGAARLDVTPQASASGLSYDQSSWRIEAGVDMVLSEGANGRLIGGVSAMAGGGTLDAVSGVGAGRIETDAVGLGISATWIGDSGFYADLQLGWRQFESVLSSPNAGALAEGVDGTGQFASVEIGQRLSLGEVTLAPQAQLSWARVSFDDFTAPGGLAVAAQDAESCACASGLPPGATGRWPAAARRTSMASPTSRGS